MGSHWTYKNELFDDIPEGIYGFIYRITNKESGKFYIGRKQFISVTRKTIKGRKNKKVTRKEMKWKEYTGSNKVLNGDIDKLGKDKFIFEILALGESKGQVNFLEVIAQIKMDVLTDTNSYNQAIGNGQFKAVKITEQLKESIKNIHL